MQNTVRNLFPSRGSIVVDSFSPIAQCVYPLCFGFPPVFTDRATPATVSCDDIRTHYHGRPRRWIGAGDIARWLVFGLILCSVMCGCRPRDSRTIAMIPATTGSELWEAAHGGAEIAGREAGFHIYWNGPTREDDVAKQIMLIERAIDDEDAGLVVVPTNYLALVGSVRRALSKHISTVVIRSSLPIPPGQLDKGSLTF